MKLTSLYQGGKFHLSWTQCEGAQTYKLFAMTQTFSYISIESFDVTYCVLEKNSDYLRFKIVAEDQNGALLDESNEITLTCVELENFYFSVIQGYYGTTLACRSKIVYDWYKVYLKEKLIAETEDPVLNLPYKLTKKQQQYLKIEGFIKKDNNYLLSAISSGIVSLPERDKKSDYCLSVVVPVYNVQFFLPRTVDSILSSSFSDLELILVNDGSTDESLKICKWYAKHYPCVSVISQKNQKVAKARNSGIKVAIGEYLAFVDSDDIVHPLMYENLYHVCKSEKVDIAIAVTVVHNDINNKELVLDLPTKTENTVVYTYEEMINNIGKTSNIYFVSPCNKIAKRKIAEQIEFPTNFPGKIVLYEDSAYTPALYSYADRFALCKDAYYIWDKRQRKTVGTLSTRYKNENTDDVWKAFIYASSYPLYYRSSKNSELSDYYNFKRLIESYDKFKNPTSLWYYWNEKLTELIRSQKLYDNVLIMADGHLKNIVEKFR